MVKREQSISDEGVAGQLATSVSNSTTTPPRWLDQIPHLARSTLPIEPPSIWFRYFHVKRIPESLEVFQRTIRLVSEMYSQAKGSQTSSAGVGETLFVPSETEIPFGWDLLRVTTFIFHLLIVAYVSTTGWPPRASVFFSICSASHHCHAVADQRRKLDH